MTAAVSPASRYSLIGSTSVGTHPTLPGTRVVVPGTASRRSRHGESRVPSTMNHDATVSALESGSLLLSRFSAPPTIAGWVRQGSRARVRAELTREIVDVARGTSPRTAPPRCRCGPWPVSSAWPVGGLPLLPEPRRPAHRPDRRRVRRAGRRRRGGRGGGPRTTSGPAAGGLRRRPRLGAGPPARVRPGLRLAGARLRCPRGDDRACGARGAVLGRIVADGVAAGAVDGRATGAGWTRRPPASPRAGAARRTRPVGRAPAPSRPGRACSA